MQAEYRVFPYRGKFYAEWWENGRRRRASLKTSDRDQVTQAVARLDRGLESSRRPHIVNVRNAWDGKQKSLGERAAALSMESYGRALLPVLGDLPAEEVTQEDCEKYARVRREAGRAEGTIVGELKKLRAALVWAEKKRLINRAPFIWKPAAPPPRDKRLTRAEAERLLAACEYPHLKLFVVLALTTAARMTAILELEWSRVDFDRGLIIYANPDRLLPAKMRATVPMNRTAREALSEARRGATCDHVIEWAGHGVTRVKEGLATAARRAGLQHVTPHMFRHSAASWLAESGVPMQEIAQFLGHSDMRVTERTYARYSPEFMRKQADALELSPIGTKTVTESGTKGHQTAPTEEKNA